MAAWFRRRSVVAEAAGFRNAGWEHQFGDGAETLGPLPLDREVGDRRG
jgi:hypothetical protein